MSSIDNELAKELTTAAPAFDLIERLSKDISNSLSSRLSENARLRAALAVIKDNSKDPVIVALAQKALEPWKTDPASF